MPQPAPKPESTGWQPEPGDEVSGPLTDVLLAWSDWRAKAGLGGDYPILRIQDANRGTTDVHCFQHILYREAIARKPQLGEIVTIKFVGKFPTRTEGQEVARYTFKIEGRDTAKDAWASLTGKGSLSGDAVTVGDIPADF